jgi:hypothetical protein
MSRRPRNLGFSIFLHHSAENSSRIGSRPGPRIDGRSQITRRTRGWPAFEPCLFEPESLFPGKQILCAETKVSKPSREITETPAETELTPTGRPIGRQMSDGREIWAQSECVVADAVAVELVSFAASLVTGKNTGKKLAASLTLRRSGVRFMPQNQAI